MSKLQLVKEQFLKGDRISAATNARKYLTVEQVNEADLGFTFKIWLLNVLENPAFKG